MSAKVISWHLLEDVLGWVAVLIVAILLFFIDLPILDPILSILIALYILYNVITNFRETLNLFLQAVPENIQIETIENHITKISCVESVHHTHIWSLDGEHHILTTHVRVGANTTKTEAIEIKQAIKEALQKYQFSHITTEIEYSEEDCSNFPQENCK